MRKRLLYNEGRVIYDVALYDNQEGIIVIEKCRWKLATTHSSPRYTPIGIVVIPVSHSSELYDEGNPCKGKAIIMSLKYMRYDDPDNGGDLQKMCWGNNEYSYDQESNPDTPILETKGIYEVGNYYKGEGVNGWLNTVSAYMPSSYLTGTRCVNNRSLYYYNSPYFPTPYMDDFGFFQTFKESFVKDGFGKENTNKMVDLQCIVDWQSGPIFNSNKLGYFPAACCCLRYRTVGTNPRDWWFPSIKELVYMVPYADSINHSISMLNTIYGNKTGYLLDLQPGAFISSSASFYSCWGWGPNDGNIAKVPRSSNYKVRAFCAV